MNLEGKHVLITGAALRVGRRISEVLLRAGADLSIHYRGSKEKAEELKAYALHLKRRCTLVQADLKDTDQIQRAVSQAVNALGPLSVLVNSASIFHPTFAASCTGEEWDELLTTNLRGQFFFAQEASKSMLSENQGVILNIADVHAEKPLKNFVAYVASKGGLIAMTRNLAFEWAPYIRVNSISPGPILPPERYTEETKAKSVTRTLLHRWGDLEDIAQAVLFLIENEYITGFDLKVDGGRHLVNP
jgi:pteridine reductase